MKQYEKTGALIASVRKEKGLTQKELAVTLHVSDTTVSKWERGFPKLKETTLKPTLTLLP